MLLDKNLFIIQDVLGDNKCFYRAIINGLVWRSNIGFLDSNNPNRLFSQKKYDSKNQYINIKQYCNDNYQTQLIDKLKYKMDRWLVRNKDNIINDLGITIGDLVKITHDMEIKTYLKNELWAGLLEQQIASNIFGVPIIILKAVVDKKNGKMVEGIIKNSVAYKNVKLKIIQIIYPSKITGLPIYLLWKKYSNGIDHYMSIYLNDLDIDSDILANSLSV